MFLFYSPFLQRCSEKAAAWTRSEIQWEPRRFGVDASLTPRCAPAPAFGTGASNVTDQRCYSSNTITTDRWASSHANVLKQAARKRQNARPPGPFGLLNIYLTALVSPAVSPGSGAGASDVQLQAAAPRVCRQTVRLVL